MLFGVVTGVRGELLRGPEGGTIFGDNRLAVALLGALSNLLIGAAIGSLAGVFVPIQRIPKSSLPAQPVGARLRFGLRCGLLFAALSLLAQALTTGLDLALGTPVLRTIWLSMLGYVAVGMVGGLAFGFVFQPLAAASALVSTRTAQPNQGIRLALRRTLIAGPVVGGILALIYGAMYGTIDGPRAGLLVGLNVGVVGLVLAGLLAGAATVTRHALVRCGLAVQGNAPWRYARFLDDAAGLSLLQKLGGGYLFMHRLLLEHFAALDDRHIARLAGRDHPPA
jgi:hypothetical protein